MTHSDIHHSYSVELAIELKDRDKAIIIHHLQYWIKINRRLKSERHFRDGHWWTYQTIEYLYAALPEFTKKSLRHHLEALVKKKILLKGRFNKSKIDKTCWYAFVNEKKFLGEEDSNNSHESPKGQSSAEKGKPIPDPKSSDLKENPLPPSKSKKQEGVFSKESIRKSLPSVADEEFLQAWLEYQKASPGSVKNIKKWIVAVVKRLRLEKHSAEELEKIAPLHKAEAEHYEKVMGTARTAACAEHVELISGSEVKIVKYKITDDEWKKQTGWIRKEKKKG